MGYPKSKFWQSKQFLQTFNKQEKQILYKTKSMEYVGNKLTKT